MIPALIWITPPTAPLDAFVRCVKGAPDGVRVAVLLRRPNMTSAEQYEDARSLRSLTRDKGFLLLTQQVDLALASGGDGVQLPERGVSVKDARSLLDVVGASRHDRAGIDRAFEEGASWCTFSPVFSSPGKGDPIGVGAFGKEARRASGPLIALGGVVSPERATEAFEAGAAGVATIRGIREPEDVQALLAPFVRTS